MTTLNDYDIEDDSGLNIVYENTEQLVRIFERTQELLVKKFVNAVKIVYGDTLSEYDILDDSDDRIYVMGDTLYARSYYSSWGDYDYTEYKIPISALDNPEQYKAELEEKKRQQEELRKQKELEEEQQKIIEKESRDYKTWLKLNKKFGKEIRVNQELGDVNNSTIIGLSLDEL